jgi:lysophospholipase L1-like esterase
MVAPSAPGSHIARSQQNAFRLLGTVRRHAKVAIASVVLTAAVGALVAPAGSPGRKLIFLTRHMECLKRPHDGGVGAIGDSITAGTGDAGWGFQGSNSWFSQTVCDGQPPYGYNAGVPNQTTEEVAARLPDLIAHRPRVVVILTGTNDVLKHRSLPHAVALIETMIARVRAAHAVPVVATLPPFRADPATAERFNQLLVAMAGRERVTVIDFHRVLADGGHYRAGLSDDGLHPNVAGARVMAREADPVLTRLMR